MVKKLIKHEFIYYLRTLAIFLPSLIVMAIFTAIVQLFKNESVWFLIIQVGAYSLLGIASIACALLTTILGVVRFYKNMYSSEGYLTFTLPISNSQHIFAKLLAYITCEIASLLVLIIAWIIALSPHLSFLSDVLPVIMQGIKELFNLINTFDIILFLIEGFIILCVSAISTPLLYYACISIGQLAKKNRILLAIGAYYIYTLIVQALSTIGSAFITLLGTMGAFENLGAFISAHPSLSIHGVMWILIIFTAAVSFVFYLITLKIMTKKLNLE